MLPNIPSVVVLVGAGDEEGGSGGSGGSGATLYAYLASSARRDSSACCTLGGCKGDEGEGSYSGSEEGKVPAPGVFSDSRLDFTTAELSPGLLIRGILYILELYDILITKDK